MKLHYFLGKQLLASTTEYTTWDGIRPQEVSLAYMCPICGDVWGRVMVEGGVWLGLRVECEKHPCQYRPQEAGSFLRMWNRNHVNELPLEVLIYEFQREIRRTPELSGIR